jgi:hypothetical protein
MKAKIIFWILIIMAVILLLIFWQRSGVKAPASALDSFAQCLADKGAVMYGADWCLHCQNEKKAFGESFKFIPYVECPDDPQRCLAAGIKGYPTWIFPDGKKLLGEQGIEKLSEESGCLLP